jgi:hypothetical protein
MIKAPVRIIHRRQTHTHREREDERERERIKSQAQQCQPASQPILVSPAPSADISFLSYYQAIQYSSISSDNDEKNEEEKDRPGWAGCVYVCIYKVNFARCKRHQRR